LEPRCLAERAAWWLSLRSSRGTLPSARGLRGAVATAG